MYFYKDGWDFVYFVDDEDITKQEVRGFDRIIGVMCQENIISLQEIIKNVEQCGWIMVDKKFLDNKLEKQYIKFGAKINIATGWGWEIYTLSRIGDNAFALIHKGDCWHSDFMISDRTDSVTYEQLAAYIDHDFEIIDEQTKET